MSEVLTVRCAALGHRFEVEGEAALPPSAQPTDELRNYVAVDRLDCPVCNPPEQLPDL